MHSILDWRNSDDKRDMVHIVVQALVEGRKVVLPLDSGYHVLTSALTPQASGIFAELDQLQCIQPPTALLVRSAEELRDFTPDLSAVAARIAERAWPGPLVIQSPVGDVRSLFGRLSASVQSLVNGNGFAAFRAAEHDAVRQALRLMPGPLVVAPITRDGQLVQHANEAAEVARAAIVIEDRQAQLPEVPSVIRVVGNQCSLVRPGALSEEHLGRASQFVILLLCTGNTCRSPMAEAIMREKLARRFGRSSANLCPYFVTSAGVSAFPGGAASPEAQTVMAKRGLDLTDHQSRNVTEHALHLADLILTMTRSHRDAVLQFLPEVESKVHLVSGGAGDVSDPFGGSESVYAACADQIDGYVQRWVDSLDSSLLPQWKVAR
ncbi:MAG: Sua5/YciO/YrdC/YwlC family protein [Pirellulaceae bacterium]|nr:Sua5/YciO/YrdC/YwlC family protein [Pirellulaceae bacterium]